MSDPSTKLRWSAEGPYTVPTDNHIQMKGMTIVAHDGEIEYPIAHVFGSNEDECEPQTVRYARLMAAAPDLLEALDQLLGVTIDEDLACGNDLDDEEDDARELALAAFRKANGE